MTKRKPLRMSASSWAEQQILEAQARGDFDDLPFRGHVIPGTDGPYDPLWWVKDKLEREKFGLGPRTIEVRRETELWLEAFERLPSEATVRKQTTALNRKIEAANQGDLGPLQPQPKLALDALVEAWRRARP